MISNHKICGSYGIESSKSSKKLRCVSVNGNVKIALQSVKQIFTKEQGITKQVQKTETPDKQKMPKQHACSPELIFENKCDETAFSFLAVIIEQQSRTGCSLDVRISKKMKNSPIAREEAQQMKMVTYAGDEGYQGGIIHEPFSSSSSSPMTGKVYFE